MVRQNRQKINKTITKIETAQELLTGRGGLAVVNRYLKNVSWLKKELRSFNSLKNRSWGMPVEKMLFQVILNFIDGTSQHLSHFDELRKDDSYKALIGEDELASTSSLKRLFKSVSHTRSRGFKRLYKRIFLWRLKRDSAPYIKLDLDTVVFDNHNAKKREKVNWTYKKVNGFQPLLMKWAGFVVAGKFREGKAHSNHGNDAAEMIREVVKTIRIKITKPIILTLDGGFLDEKLMDVCDELRIAYIMGGKQFSDIKTKLSEIPKDEFGIFRKESAGGLEWYYTEFMDKRKKWKKASRLIATYLNAEGDQLLVPGTGKVNLNYTNLCVNSIVTQQFEDAGCGYLGKTENIIMLAHNRGEDELIHRHIKDFAGEEMPFLKFEMNAEWFHLMIFSFNMHQGFKEDVFEKREDKQCYPTTFRRRFIDFAGRIVRHAHTTVLKVRKSVKESITLDSLWVAAAKPT